MASPTQNLTDPSTPNYVGPGSPAYRFRRLLEELEKRFPDPEPFSARAPEQRYLKLIDEAVGHKIEIDAMKPAFPTSVLAEFLESLPEDLGSKKVNDKRVLLQRLVAHGFVMTREGSAE